MAYDHGRFLVLATSWGKARSFYFRKVGRTGGEFEGREATIEDMRAHLAEGKRFYRARGSYLMSNQECYPLAGLPAPPVPDLSEHHPLQDAEAFRDAKDRLGFSMQGLADALHINERSVRRFVEDGAPYTVACLMGHWLDPEEFPLPPRPHPTKRNPNNEQ